MSRSAAQPFARDRRAPARVTNEELFFDLIYAFAITQLSHRLLEQLTPLGALQTLVLWFAVWLGWQYTCWVTNWFNPENLRMRLMLFALMLLGLAMGATIPAAFAGAGLAFAACYAAIQVGRTLFVLLNLRAAPALRPNFRRIMGWVCISAALWIAGGLSDGSTRLTLWIAAVASEYLAPMIGFALPVLGRSRTSEWTIEGGHLAERNQLFVMIALGESILATGASFSQSPHLDAPTLIALAVAFAGSVAMWWIYFDTASEHGTHAITGSDDPGRIGAYFHYVHVTLIAGIIVA
ncbi:MAG TPA: low temperature requirement protein A, partial [Burkholderiaceae bacterium]|nr:low temperature requirement protein A [Burkholderiaceae bacterium]